MWPFCMSKEDREYVRRERKANARKSAQEFCDKWKFIVPEGHTFEMSYMNPGKILCGGIFRECLTPEEWMKDYGLYLLQDYALRTKKTKRGKHK